MAAVTLTPGHLPTDLADLLTQYTTAQETAQEAHNRLIVAPLSARPPLQEEAEQAALAARQAHGNLASATARANRQIIDSSAGAFFAHIEAARTALATAEAEMRSAAAAAALYATATTHAGRPILDTDTNVARDNPGRQRAMYIVSETRDLLGMLPDALD
ncbi:hypothetical protein [Streptomyces mirabilis]|uniref:hypothetical protein n=1 Tax=Streptomyces mirabilis TaxID=68239 RepID=UPI0033F6FA27